MSRLNFPVDDIPFVNINHFDQNEFMPDSINDPILRNPETVQPGQFVFQGFAKMRIFPDRIQCRSDFGFDYGVKAADPQGDFGRDANGIFHLPNTSSIVFPFPPPAK